MYVTENGSTLAIKGDGDIISVCAKIPKGQKRATDSSRALLEFATKNGGNKLDTYDGNYGFYRRCGFKPVSYCDFVEEFVPDPWKEGHELHPKKYKEENVIFFEYTGEQSKYKTAKEFYSNLKFKTNYDYDQAEAFRNIEMYFKNNL